MVGFAVLWLYAYLVSKCINSVGIGGVIWRERFASLCS